MSLEPLVSIVLPVRDGEAFIADALESALGQTYRNIEVIVVDDGSRDDTRAVVEARMRHDARLKLVVQANHGVAAARNRAIAEANGELIAPLDADDLWDPTKIERQVHRIVEAGIGTGFVYCWWVSIDAAGKVLDRSPRWRFEGSAAETLLQVNYTGNASVPLFRRHLLNQVGGYDVTLRVRDAEGGEDWDVALKVAEQSAVAVVPETLVAYRRRSDSMSSQRNRMWRSHLLVISAARQRRPNLSAASIRRAHDQFALYLAGVCFWCGRYGQAIIWSLRALRSGMAFRILPHIVRVMSTVVLSSEQSKSQDAVLPGVSFWRREMPEPLIPYDRIYQRR